MKIRLPLDLVRSQKNPAYFESSNTQLEDAQDLIHSTLQKIVTFFEFTSEKWRVPNADIRNIALLATKIVCAEKIIEPFFSDDSKEERTQEEHQIAATEYYKERLRNTYGIKDENLVSLIITFLFNESGGLLSETDEALMFLCHPLRNGNDIDNLTKTCSLASRSLSISKQIEVGLIEEQTGKYKLTYKMPLAFLNMAEVNLHPSNPAKAPIGNVEVSINITKNAKNPNQFDLELQSFDIDLTLDAENNKSPKTLAFWEECGEQWKNYIIEETATDNDTTQTSNIYHQYWETDKLINKTIKTLVDNIPVADTDKKTTIQEAANTHKTILRKHLLKAAYVESTLPIPQDEKQKKEQQTRLKIAVENSREEFCAAVFKDRNKFVAFTRPYFSTLATAFIGICTFGIAPAINKYVNNTWFFLNRTKTGKAYRELHKQFVPEMRTILTH